MRNVYAILIISLILLPVSCLKDKPDDIPNTFQWDPEVAFPVGTTAIGMNEASGFDTTLLQINDTTQLPLWVDLLDIDIEGEAVFNFGNIASEDDPVTSLMVRVEAYNEFPVEVWLQVYFTESNGEAADSLFVDQPMKLPPGSIAASGKPDKPSYSVKDAILEEERLDNLENATGVAFKAIIQNAEIDSTLIDFYPTYEIDIHIGAMVNLNLSN